MRLTLKYVVVMIIGLSIIYTCEKDDIPNNKEFVSAVIINGGPVEVDGCGWLVKIDSVNYHAVNLPENFKENDLSVIIKYREDSTVFLCGRGAVPIPTIYIEEISLDLIDLKYPEENDNIPIGDQFMIDTAYIEGDILIMNIGYSGGCEDHEFKMYVITTNPDLMLYHNANNDPCEAFITRSLFIDLLPLRDHEKNYVIFNLRQSPEMSSYYSTLTYYY